MNMLSSGEPQPFKLQIEDYELLDRAGAFQGARVELIGGMIVAMDPQSQAHAFVKMKLAYRLQHALELSASPFMAIAEASLALSPYDLPDPDILIATATAERSYLRVEQVGLVIEVSDSSLRRDLGTKREMYAAGGIAEYWVVDLDKRQVHQFWSLAAATYGNARIVPLAGELRSTTMPDLAIDGSGIL